ncbi:hypothetical protein CMV_027746 [Castanea mollissima]|uniref:Uncharacterized protein n=1 Tax=Castanea mollissima TaxID=60419 RepID=A0A8J4QHG0_9ROSI|nr:hypothetical protein CMV_027746 [Castanea mollissima]
MDYWMYKEHARKEESSPDVNNQSSLCDSLTKLEDKDFTVVNETEDRVDHFEDKITSQTDLDAENEEGDAEDSSIIVGPITSDLDELTAKAMDSKQPGGDMLSQKRDALSETTNMDSGSQIEGLEKMTEDICEDEGNKNKAIKLLKKEIDSLKTKIVELEKQCGGGDTRLHQGTKEDLTSIQEQHIDEKLPSGQDDAPMSYTPYIKIEPLVCKEYTNKRPVLIPYHKGGRRLHIGFQEFTEDLATRSHAIMEHLHSIRVGSINPSEVNIFH